MVESCLNHWFSEREHDASMSLRDRLIVTAAALPAVLGFGLALGITRDLIVSGIIGAAACLVAAAVSLTPSVQRARMRLLRRKYPEAS